MAIKEGDRLPSAEVLKKGENGLEKVDLSQVKGRMALFAVPGAFTSTCSNSHLPSFVKSAEGLRGKGVDRIICVAVNDPSVMEAWGKAGGAGDARIEMMSDADGSFTRALGMEFDAPQFGMYGRSRRYSMLVEDGVVKVLNLEANPGAFEVSGGDKMLERL
ncbi:redoxin family protein [Paracoccus sp. S-4012]|uniref:peroxiredoxin n=1 Tax=Paracoccus sp. S-4012 TaxID=2665648 RepID=UPI0012AFB239|nr:peroxiredoxin [Paracoccus sp. S-4012]MRX50625.1 redoxin family protein [Paracoccus sp. S-4012]